MARLLGSFFLPDNRMVTDITHSQASKFGNWRKGNETWH
jgi:hypothetical protein